MLNPTFSRALVLGAFCTFHIASAVAAPTFETAKVDTVIDQAMADQRIVGTVVLVVKDGELVYQRAAGLADREQNIAMQEDAIFRYASLTKPLVSAAAMRMVEEGTITLDDTVDRWLPAFKPQMVDGTVVPITLKQLMTHTAGLRYGFLEGQDGPYKQANVSDGMNQPGLSLEENLQRIASVPLSYQPGSSWGYSMSLDVLGGVLSAASGKSLPEVVELYVTKPLKMQDTAFSITDKARLAVPYQDGKPAPVKMAANAIVPIGAGAAQFSPERIFDANSYASGGAGMAGTAHDFMKFLMEVRSAQPSIVTAETLTQMKADQTGPQANARGPGWGFGYGWAVLADSELAKTPQANGTIQWGGAYGHSWFFDPVNDVAVIALTNTAFEGMSGAFPRDIRNAVYEALAKN
ncbi:beta-lactamase family protein [Alcaligenaceae bacterium]|nr:beta-lactamase family protein [Alcaligenaceae bacterium]